MISLYVQYSSINKKPIIAAKLKRGKKRAKYHNQRMCARSIHTQKWIIKYKSTKDEKLMQASVNVKIIYLSTKIRHRMKLPYIIRENYLCSSQWFT